MGQAPVKLWTVGQIARRCKVSIHIVENTLRNHDIEPDYLAAHYRVFKDSTVEIIADLIKNRFVRGAAFHADPTVPTTTRAGNPETPSTD